MLEEEIELWPREVAGADGPLPSRALSSISPGSGVGIVLQLLLFWEIIKLNHNPNPSQKSDPFIDTGDLRMEHQ